MNTLEKLTIIKRVITGYIQQYFWSNGKRIYIAPVLIFIISVMSFPRLKDCIEAVGHSLCEIMSVFDLRDMYHILLLALESQK